MSTAEHTGKEWHGAMLSRLEWKQTLLFSYPGEYRRLSHAMKLFSRYPHRVTTLNQPLVYYDSKRNLKLLRYFYHNRLACFDSHRC